MQSSPSGFTLPVVEAWSTTINHFERGGLVEAAFRQARTLSVVLRLALQTSQRDFVEVSDESGGKGGGVIGHGGETLASLRLRTRGQPRPLVSTGSVDGYADKDERDDNH